MKAVSIPVHPFDPVHHRFSRASAGMGRRMLPGKPLPIPALALLEQDVVWFLSRVGVPSHGVFSVDHPFRHRSAALSLGCHGGNRGPDWPPAAAMAFTLRPQAGRALRQICLSGFSALGEVHTFGHGSEPTA